MEQIKVEILKAVNALRDTTVGKVYDAEKYLPGEIVEACGYTDRISKEDKFGIKLVDDVGDEVFILPDVDGKYLKEV